MLILTILKWIGIVLLIIFALALLLLFYCLFSNQNYGIVSNFDRGHYYIFLNDSLRLYRVMFSRNNKKNKFEISLFFTLFKINNKKDSKENDKKTKKEKIKKEKATNKKQKKKSKDKKNNKEKLFNIINDRGSKNTLKLIVNELIGFLKKLLPKIFKADIDFSTGEPDTTGYVTAALAVIPFVNTKDSNIHPDFISENPYISGKMKIKGSIKLIQIVVVAFRLFKDKGFRRFLQKIR